jgi:hypothetical protein
VQLRIAEAYVTVRRCSEASARSSCANLSDVASMIACDERREEPESLDLTCRAASSCAASAHVGA